MADAAWKGESAEELVAKDTCPKCFGALDTGWECNKCGFDASHLVKAERKGLNARAFRDQTPSGKLKIKKAGTMAGTAAKMAVMLVVGIVMGGCLVALAGNTTVKTPLSKHYRAWVEREKLDYPTVAPYAAQVGGDAFLKSERWKNAQKDDLIDMRDAVAVYFQKTIDSGEWTVSIVDVDGKTSTMWLSGGEKSGGKVRSISPY